MRAGVSVRNARDDVKLRVIHSLGSRRLRFAHREVDLRLDLYRCASTSCSFERRSIAACTIRMIRTSRDCEIALEKVDAEASLRSTSGQGRDAVRSEVARREPNESTARRGLSATATTAFRTCTTHFARRTSHPHIALRTPHVALTSLAARERGSTGARA